MSKRARLPGADELFGPRRDTASVDTSTSGDSDQETSTDPSLRTDDAQSTTPLIENERRRLTASTTNPHIGKSTTDVDDESTHSRDDLSTRPHSADRGTSRDAKRPTHDEKITFYCTFEELTRLEESRLRLRREAGIATDRGGIIRAAIRLALDDLDRDGSRSQVARELAARRRPTR